MITTRMIDGIRVAFVLPTIPDDAPVAVREGLARRAMVTLDGTCPCGAVMVMPNRATRRANARKGRPSRVNIVHGDNCPAIDSVLADAIARWRA